MDEAGAFVCCECATIAADAPLNSMDHPSSSRVPPQLTRMDSTFTFNDAMHMQKRTRFWNHAYDRETSRALQDRRNMSQMSSMLRSAATRLGFAYASGPSMQVFEAAHTVLFPIRQRDAHTTRTMRRWGSTVSALAAASLYAVLRRDHRAVDLAAVAVATEQASSAVSHACAMLRHATPHLLPRPLPNDPELYLDAELTFLATKVPSSAWVSVLRAPKGIFPLDAKRVRELATKLLSVCKTYEIPYSLEAPSFAYAILMHAIEGAYRRAMPVRALAKWAPDAAAYAYEDARCVLVAPIHASVSTVLSRYAEMEKMLAALVQAVPWANERPVSKRERDRSRHSTRAGAVRHVARSDVVVYMSDALELATRTLTPCPVLWTHAFGAKPRGMTTNAQSKNDSDEKSRRCDGGERNDREDNDFLGSLLDNDVVDIENTCAPQSTAEQLGLTGAQIDALSESEVDALLFKPDEMDRYFRSVPEQALWRRLKGWDAEPPTNESDEASARTPAASKRVRLYVDQAHLRVPIAQETDGASDWDGVPDDSNL